MSLLLVRRSLIRFHLSFRGFPFHLAEIFSGVFVLDDLIGFFNDLFGDDGVV